MIGFTTADLWGSLAQIGIVLGVLAALAAVVVWRQRRRGSTTIALDVALSLSGWWVMFSALALVFVAIKAFTADFVEVGELPQGVPWPAGLPCDDYTASTAPALACGSPRIIDATVLNPGTGLRVLAAVTQAVGVLLNAIPAGLIAVICFQTLRGQAFGRLVSRALFAGAIALLLLGIANDLLGSVLGTVALREVLAPDSEWYPMSFSPNVSLLPIVGALALAALATVFRQGGRLQAEKEALQRDTEGLV